MMKTDNINHPAHYVGQVETIDFIIDKVADPMSFLTANVIKYVSRYDKKGNPVEDLNKARKYLEWAINYLEKGKIR